mgnify:CR=1 FL=1
MRKKLPISKKHLKDTTDDLWRRCVVKKWGQKCVCGKQADHCHHFFPRSNSAVLRLEIDNGVPLCNGCHMGIHFRGDPTINQRIINFRGIGWYKDLETKSKEEFRSGQTVKWYKETIEVLKEYLEA